MLKQIPPTIGFDPSPSHEISLSEHYLEMGHNILMTINHKPINMRLVTKGIRILRDEGVITFLGKSMNFVIQKAKAQTYKIGSGRICPICGFDGIRFTSSGNPPRPESQCPQCGARERHRLLWYYIQNETDLTDDGDKILHFAPTSNFPEKLREYGNDVLTTDLMMDSVDINADITRLPFDDGEFNWIICSHVLEHIPDDRAAMSEMSRILDSEGEALIMVPKNKARNQTYEDSSIISPEARQREFGQENHVRQYGTDFTERLSNSGLDVSTETYADSLDNDTIERYGLRVRNQHLDRIEFEDIHDCSK
jgi:SAM-dependent methyltransferase